VDARDEHGGGDRFEALVAQAIDELPAWVHQRLDNVDVLIEAQPPADQPNLLGLYEGVPLTRRGLGYSGALPDRITLFRRSIEVRAGSDDELRRMVRETVVHEVAHFFGISDDRLQELGRA
jgi:predicted Zn-dependent protease with MMP-like domain